MAESFSDIIGDFGSHAARGLWRRRRWRRFFRFIADARTHVDTQPNTVAIPHTDPAAQRGG